MEKIVSVEFKLGDNVHSTIEVTCNENEGKTEIIAKAKKLVEHLYSGSLPVGYQYWEVIEDRTEDVKTSKIVLNQLFIDKLDNIANDLKVYLNFNSVITESIMTDEELNDIDTTKSGMRFIPEETLSEILELRHQLKKINHKLKNILK